MAHPKSPTRRSVLAAAQIVPFTAVQGSAANSAVSVGLIGAGGRGTYDAGLLVKNTDARITAVCDIFGVIRAADSADRKLKHLLRN